MTYRTASIGGSTSTDHFVSDGNSCTIVRLLAVVHLYDWNLYMLKSVWKDVNEAVCRETVPGNSRHFASVHRICFIIQIVR